mmetsp:Transcript_76336/g.210722  ORF Transcript_76336/g.210722 Transcript_76336/m.210722 type:complete len:301 (-) Transcript_76336:1236-2138(-)
MQTEDPVLDDGTDREVLEGPIELVPAGIRVLRLLLETSPALITKPIDRIDRWVLVVPADQVNLRRVSHLEREEEADSLQRKTAAIHKVAQEQVVHGVDIPVLSLEGSFVPRKEAHQIQVLPVDVPIHLDGSPQLQHHVLALQDLQDLIAELGYLHGVQEEPVRVWVWLPRRWLQEVLYDERGHARGRPRRGDVRHDVGGLDFPALFLQLLYVYLLDLVCEVLLQAHYNLRRHPHVALRHLHPSGRHRLARVWRPHAWRRGRPRPVAHRLPSHAWGSRGRGVRRSKVDGAAWHVVVPGAGS